MHGLQRRRREQSNPRVGLRGETRVPRPLGYRDSPAPRPQNLPLPLWHAAAPRKPPVAASTPPNGETSRPLEARRNALPKAGLHLPSRRLQRENEEAPLARFATNEAPPAKISAPSTCDGGSERERRMSVRGVASSPTPQALNT